MRYFGRDLTRRFHGDRLPPIEGCGRPQEVQVVRVVADRVQPLRLTLRQVVLVRAYRALVGFRGICIASDADVDVSGHVHHVPRGRHQRAEPIRASHRAIGIIGGLQHVNVIVKRSWMVGVAAR